MELLAPAGNIENFSAALDAGADAVYIGVPGINARNLSRDLQLEEIWAMIHHAHGLGKKVYLAANSLVLEKEISSLIETLTLIAEMKPDALIVQDMAIISLVRKHFPSLRLHASTLMTGHNSDGVNLFAAMGCMRAVVARELTLKEIVRIVSKATIEIEVFVHGAMCYSYSGLCLFSSFLGGKSSMRGRCVQPCRRGYTWQGKPVKQKDGRKQLKNTGGGSYLFSMNDLEGFTAVAPLQDAGVTSLKIEGRLRTANYVSKIVQAYRLVIDSPPAERQSAIEKAMVLSEEAMGRKTSSGYFFSPQPQQAIVPFHSGNMGIYMGNFSSIKAENDALMGTIRVKKALEVGDRLRIHVEATGERKAFTARYLLAGNGKVERCTAGDVVKLALPDGLTAMQQSRVELYKVDNNVPVGSMPLLTKTIADCRQNISSLRNNSLKKIDFLQKKECGRFEFPLQDNARQAMATQKGKRTGRQGKNLDVWLKTDSTKIALGRMPFTPDMLLLSMDRIMISKSALIKNYLGKNSRKVIWALPPVILENDLAKVQKQIRLLLNSGFKTFQITHLSQISLFGNERVHLCSDYTLNLTNSQALGFAGQAGLEAAQLSIEMDRGALSVLIQGYKDILHKAREEARKTRTETNQHKIRLGLTVYGAPALFTSRLSSAAHFQYNKTLLSPKGEELYLQKSEGVTIAVAAKPFSLLPYLAELQEMGLDYVVIDLSHINCGEKEMQELTDRINDNARLHKLPTFNYLGTLE